MLQQFCNMHRSRNYLLAFIQSQFATILYTKLYLLIQFYTATAEQLFRQPLVEIPTYLWPLH